MEVRATAYVFSEPFLVLHVFSFLEPEQLADVSLVNSQWYALANSELLWKDLCRRRRIFGSWEDVRHLESAKQFLVQETVFQRKWRTGDQFVHSIPGFRVTDFRSNGGFIFGYASATQQVYVWQLFGGSAPDAGCFLNPSCIPLHIIPSLTLPVSLRV